jgi:hypothetical protein
MSLLISHRWNNVLKKKKYIYLQFIFHLFILFSPCKMHLLFFLTPSFCTRAIQSQNLKSMFIYIYIYIIVLHFSDVLWCVDHRNHFSHQLRAQRDEVGTDVTGHQSGHLGIVLLVCMGIISKTTRYCCREGIKGTYTHTLSAVIWCVGDTH